MKIVRAFGSQDFALNIKETIAFGIVFFIFNINIKKRKEVLKICKKKANICQNSPKIKNFSKIYQKSISLNINIKNFS
jgi:hypothetical protein